MSRNSVKVCVRTRPTQYFAQDNIFIDAEHNTIQITTGQAEPGAVLNNKQNSFKFRFDHVFHNSSQTDVYDLFARDIVQNVVDGINGCIMSYGQTGSGKTFTMMGDTQNYEHRGVAPRSLSQIFNEVNSRIEFEYRITCTYMEIYNERIYDLLTDLSNPDVARDYTIVEEIGGRGTFVRGLTEIEVQSENEALNLLFSGELSRTTAQHKLNRKSNRSHSLFTVYLEQRQRSGVSERVGHSKLHLVDLAGSERLKKTLDTPGGGAAMEDTTRKESMCINQSLTYLEQCVVALARRGHTHVPYRQSKLTNILKDALGSNCNTLMISCMWGESAHLEETTSTLRLSARMMRVQNETTMVETVDSAALIKKQTKLINALKQELLMHDALVERTGVNYEPYTPEQQNAVAQMLDRYVEAKEADEEDLLSISSYRQMLEVCKQFKKIVLNLRTDVVNARNEAMATMAGSRPMTNNGFGGTGTADFADSKIAEDYNPNAPAVGEKDKGHSGFGLGVASTDARPSTGIDGVPRVADAKYGGTGPGQGVGILKGAHGSPGSPAARKGVDFAATSAGRGGDAGGVHMEGQNALFDSYIRNNTEGKQLFADFSAAKSTLKELKGRIRELTMNVNEAKSNIDVCQHDIELRKQSRIEMLKRSGLKPSQTEDIVDEDEFRLMKDLREAKRMYKNGFESLQKYKSQLIAVQANVDNCKSELNSKFSTWCSQSMESAGEFDNSSSFEARGAGTGGGFDMGDPGDQLDDQEAFDRLELQRVLSNDPDSLAFFNAQKTRRANITQNSTNIRQMQKNKRYG